MPELMIVWPKMQSSASQIHLYLPGYAPGKKRRGLDETTLCSQPAHMYWEKLDTIIPGTPQREWTTTTTPTGRWHQPFVEGFEFVKDPWRFCPICLGRAVEQAGLQDAVAALIAARIPLT